MPRIPVTQYPLTTTTNTTATTTTTLAAKSNDLNSLAASYASVGDLKSNRKHIETTSGQTGNKTGAVEDAGCYWVVSPGWKLRRRGTDGSQTDQPPVVDEKCSNAEDKASSPDSQPEYVDDIHSHSAQGTGLNMLLRWFF